MASTLSTSALAFLLWCWIAGAVAAQTAQSRNDRGPDRQEVQHLLGPYDVTRPDGTGPEDNPRRPQISWVSGGQVVLSYHRYVGNQDVRVVRAGDGLAWGASKQSIQDVAPGTRVLSPTRVVEVADGLGIAWSYLASSKQHHIRYTTLTRDGCPLGPSVAILDGLQPPEERLVVGTLALASCANGQIVTVWPEVVWVDGESERRMRWSSSGDRGTTWRPPSRVVGFDFQDTSFGAPSLATGAEQRLYLAAVDDRLPARLLVSRYDALQFEWAQPGHVPVPERRAIVGMASLAAGDPGGTGPAVLGVSATTSSDPVAPPTAVTFWRSFDSGVSWTMPVEVSQEVSPNNHYDPKLVCDSDGRWHAAWISAPPFVFIFDVYYSSSVDGVTWTPPVRVNPQAGTAMVSVPRSVSIVTDDQGEVYVAYMYRSTPNSNPEAIHVMTTRERPYDPLDGTPPFTMSTSPNPFRLVTHLEIASPGAGAAEVRLYDARGRTVRTWSDILLSRGVHRLEWDGRTATGQEAASGVYFWEAEIETDAGRRRSRARSVRVR